MKFAERISRLGTESAFSVLAVVNKLKAEGRDITSFSIGEPDFDTPQNIIDCAKKALDGGFTHYTPSAGIMDVRETIAKYVSKTRNIPVSTSEVVITPGAKPVIFYTILALINAGDEVIYPTPGFPIYESVINFVGGKAVPIALEEKNEFSFDVEKLKKLVTPKTKLIIINSPQNPTGGVLPQETLNEIAKIAIEKDIMVLSDEIYSRLVYDAPFASIASIPGMKERTIILDGFSKTYSMTGWRLGYGVMPTEMAEVVAKLITNCESCTATFTQMAGAEALTGPQDAADAMRDEFLARRNLIVSELNKVPGFKCLSPKGAFYVYPNVTEACKLIGAANSKELQERLLHEGEVAVLARTAFGVKAEGENDEYIRLSYATSQENILKGVAKIKAFMEKNIK